MKYWLLTTEYPPFFGGGISTYCYFTARMLSQGGHAVTVFVADASVNTVKEETSDECRLVLFNPDLAGTASFLGHSANLSNAFAQVLKTYVEREGKPGIIEAQEYLGIAYYLLNQRHLLYEWCRNIPVVITTHSPAFLYLHYNHVPVHQYPEYWIGEMERFCMQAADAIISPSSYLVEKIKEYIPLSNNNIHIVPNPFEIEEPVTGENTGNSGKIVFYGKLSAQKGTFKLLQYFEHMWASGLGEALHLYGGQDIVYHPEGKTMGTIVRERYGARISGGKLVLHPKVAPAQKREELAGVRMVIVPSTVDNFPYVVLEMMGLGNIVLVSKQGGQAEIVQDGVNGFVFDHDTEGDFERQFNRIMHLTTAERDKVGQQARDWVARAYNAEAVYQQKWPVISQLVAGFEQPEIFPFTRPLVLPPPLAAPVNDLLSIVIPYYNMGAYVEETIASVERSTYVPKEIIVINDGSGEAHSVEVLNRLRNRPGVQVIDTSNHGLAKARNRGAGAAQGSYLAFLDADDTVAPDYYVKAVAVLRQYSNVHYAGCWTQYFEGTQKVWPTFTPEPPLILFHNTINSSALVYKRAAFLAGGKNDATMPFAGLEDYDSVLSLLAQGYRGVVLPEILFNYRVRSNSMVRGITRNKKLFLAEYIAQKHLNLYATFAAEIAGLLQANGPGIFLDNPSLDRSYVKHPLLNGLIRGSVALIKKQPLLKKAALAIFRKIKS